MSKRGWGYNANRRTQDQILIDGISKHFENEELKVYQTQDCLYHGCYLTIRILFNKTNKTIKLIITGKNSSGNRITPISKNVTELRTLKNIKIEILNQVINFY